jgi:predicted RNA-binding protein with EMAP domain
MRRFSRIVEEYKFSGRETNMLTVIDDIIQNIEYSYEEKKDFYNMYLHEDICQINDEMGDQYLEDLQNGRIREIYNQDQIANYEELRQYLHETYGFDLDQDTDGVYVDCMWLKYLITSMTLKGVKNINN